MNQSMPTFGLCQGIKVLSATSMIAGPFATALFAENGADVIHLENARATDMVRQFGKTYSQDHRNQRNLALNFFEDEGRDILIKLIKETDILIESSKAGTWKKQGLSDEVLWEINPKLVIVHVSGFGQTGLPEYVGKPAYDMICQVFSGYTALNGNPDPAAPALIKPYTGDYFSGYNAAFFAMAAYHNAQKTGKGESIDVAMNEALLRVQAGMPIGGFTYDQQPTRTGNTEAVCASDIIYRAKDGDYLAITPAGPGIVKLCELIGLKDHPMFEVMPERMVTWAEPRGVVFNKALGDYVASVTADEAHKAISEIGIGVEYVMTYKRIANHPQYLAREMIMEWYDPCSGENVKGVGLVPKLTNNPGQIWCGAPTWGMNNEDILGEMGYTAEQISEMYDKGILNKAK